MITGLFLCSVLEINRTALLIYAIILEYNERISNMPEAPTLKNLLDTRKKRKSCNIDYHFNHKQTRVIQRQYL